MTNFTDKLKSILEECEKATPGPWSVSYRSPNPAELFHHKDYGQNDRIEGLHPLGWTGRNLNQTVVKDWEFIASARTQLPAALRALMTAIEALQSYAHSPYPHRANQAIVEIEKEFS